MSREALPVNPTEQTLVGNDDAGAVILLPAAPAGQ